MKKKNWILFAMNCIDLIKHEKNIPVEKIFSDLLFFVSFLFLCLDYEFFRFIFLGVDRLVFGNLDKI